MSTPQAPIRSGFGPATTTADIIAGCDLTGRIAIVTGGHGGLGLETTRTLASAGATVIVPARDRARAVDSLEGIPRVEVDEMDLLDPASIDGFAKRFVASGRPLHLLVNSAGIMALPELTRDARGFEYHFATNHLGHFQLTARLFPALQRANGARVISVSAWAHRLSPVVLEDPHFERRAYQPMLGYAQSKSANNLFAVALDARGASHGVRAFSLHPGSIVATGIGRNFSVAQRRAFGVIDDQGNPILDPSRQLKTLEQGAATQVWCAISPRLAGMGGVYCENCEVAGVVPEGERSGWSSDASTRLLGVMPQAIDPVAAERLWRLSEALTTPFAI